jgi:hypothetical protein
MATGCVRCTENANSRAIALWFPRMQELDWRVGIISARFKAVNMAIACLRCTENTIREVLHFGFLNCEKTDWTLRLHIRPLVPTPGGAGGQVHSPCRGAIPRAAHATLR